jgi:hypothetical protein
VSRLIAVTALFFATLVAASGAALLHAYRQPPIALRGPIPNGRYRIRVVVTAATDPERTTTITSRPFTVGGGSKRTK